MELNRRQALTTILKGGAAAAAVAAVAAPLKADQPEVERPRSGSAPVPNAAVALLYDATKCIGCKACVAACAQANDTPADTRADGLHQAPRDLNDLTRNIIKLYEPEDGGPRSFVKRQCMHCLDPGCAAGCPFQALHKDPTSGIVTWTPEKCIGCRYCTITCPYHVPRFQWVGYNPRVTKCELCKDRLAVGLQPACTTVCPTKAVVFGPRDVLLEDAKARIRQNPGRYYEGRVYGEFENGGTQALYLAAVPFEKLGLPELGTESVPAAALKWQKRIYQYMILPGVLYLGLVQVIRGRFGKHEEHLHEEEKKTGLRAQL